MPVITANLSTASLADATTGWLGPSGQLDTEVYKQASTIGSDGAYTYQTGKNVLASCTFTPAANLNMTANYSVPHLYWTMRCDVFPFCELLNTGSTNSGLMLRITDGSGNWTQWHVAGRDTWDGSWRTFVFDLTNTADVHSSSGTLNLADVDIITWYTDNSSSGNIRIIDNTWLDAVRYGDGLQAESATTEAVSFSDIAADDQLTANYYGVLQMIDGVIFAQGGIEIGDAAGSATTNFVSSGETLYFRDQVVDAGHYKISGVASATSTTDIDIDGLVCATVGGAGAELDFSDTDINSLAIDGSTFTDMGDITVNVGTVATSKFNGCGATSIGSGVAFNDCAWGLSGGIALAGTLNNSTISNSTASASVTTADLESINTCKFVSDGSNHAVEISSIGDGSLTWDSTLSGYVAGSTGSPVTPGSTGNEAIFVNVGSGTLTINVADGASIPSIRSAGATVNVIAGQKDFTFTLNPSITGYEWRVYTLSVAGDFETGTPLAGEESATADNQTVTHGYTSQPIAVQILASGYVEKIEYFTLTPVDLSITINLDTDINA